jgi:hypothetical protein
MRAATGLGWIDTLKPQGPAISIAALVVSALWAIDFALAARAGSPLTLLLQFAAAGVIGLAFAKWCPFRDARVLLYDAVSDHLPTLAARVWSDVAATQQAEKRKKNEHRRRARKAASEAEVSIPS